jgi:hypothetical protein
MQIGTAPLMTAKNQLCISLVALNADFFKGSAAEQGPADEG